MNYRNKKIAITGAHGFIGEQLTETLMRMTGCFVYPIEGDIRDPKTFDIDYTFDYLFHFAAPSSQVQFKRDPQYCIETTLKGFMNAADACRKYGVKLIYPSTGLLSNGDTNEYARCKKLCEDYVRDQDAIGVRIFATYGPGEGHKRDYASVPYLFARDMVQGKSPVIFGDGKQVRDFIYIYDVVQSILHIADEATEKIIDIGSGDQISFNAIVDVINGTLKKKIKPEYIEKPGGYVQETSADPKTLWKYYWPEVNFIEGISKLVKELKK